MTNAVTAEPDFIRRQRDFAAHIRQPDRRSRPKDVELRRMEIYNELFFNNVAGFLADGFPVLRRTLPEDRWQSLARDFFARHACVTPLFTRLGEEFLTYLQREQVDETADPPWLVELAHYEWVELALSLSDADRQLPELDADGDLLAGHPVVSPLAWSLSYVYPVHRIGPDYQPDMPPDSATHLLVYRDRQERIGFLQINPVIRALLDRLKTDSAISGFAALQSVVAELRLADPALALQAGLELFDELHRRDVLLGTASRLVTF